MENSIFFAGVAKVDITPAMGSILGVDFSSHYARFVHDPLYVKVLLFRDDNKLIAIIIVDICIMGTDFMDEVKAQIYNNTVIHPDDILLASNHNHGSGDVVGLLGGAADITYRSKLPGLIVEAVIRAKENMKPVKIAVGSVDVPEYVRCRRYLMSEAYVALNPVTGAAEKVKTNPIGDEDQIVGPVSEPDPGLGFLMVKGLDDQWVAVLANYSLHYVGDWHVDSVTADFFGEFSRQIEEKLGASDGFIGIMTNGTSGDVNIWDFMDPDRFPKGDYEKTKLIGGELAQRVVDELPSLHWQINPTLTVKLEKLKFKVMKPSEDELEKAAEIFMKNDFGPFELTAKGLEILYAREQLLLNEFPDTVTLPIQALRIGNLVIGALPGEFFAETGIVLKQDVTAYNYFSIGLANAYGGYVPPAKEMERGGYETWRARSSFLEPDAEELIRKAMLHLITKV